MTQENSSLFFMPPKGSQLTLDILPAPAYAPENFIQSPSNQEAFSTICSWPKWPFPILSLYGPKGCGKTYLCHIWKTQSRAHFLTVRDCQKLLTTDLREGNLLNFILDDLIILPENEKILFDFYNWIVEKKGSLLITSLPPLSQTSYTLNDLKSRLKSLRALEITGPDEKLLQNLMQRYFNEAHLYVGEDLLKFALVRLERSFENILTFCEALNKTALSTQRKITFPFLKYVLENFHSLK